MQSTARSLSKNRFATAEKIRTIDFSRSGIAGTGSMSPRSRRTLAVYVILVKWDYTGISAPMGAIADAVFRSSCGAGGSVRTLQRANRELEERGYITISNCRTGFRSKGALIHFNLDAFAYFTGQKTKSVSPLPTLSHNVVSRETKCDFITHTTSCRASDRTRDKACFNSQDLTKKEKEPRAGARASKKTSPRKKNLVLFSVGVVLSSLNGVHRADRRAARARARCEIDAICAGVDLVNPSGVDWEYWEKRWADMPIAIRENTARREIVPMLLSRGGGDRNPEPVAPPSPPEPNPLPLPPKDAPTAEEIRAIRLQLESSMTLPSSPGEISRSVSAPEENQTKVDLPDDELAVLVAARDRARSRVDSR